MIYEIADKRIEIIARFPYTEKFCQGYLSNDQTSPCDLSIRLSEEEFLSEKAQSERYLDGYVENIAIYRKLCYQLVPFDRFLFHGVVLEYEGKGYLFTGRSGRGKSTHTSLWCKYVEGASILNGDKPIIAMEGDKLFAYGTPWNGKEGIGHKGRVELKGICFIEQAKTNYIEEPTPSEQSELLFKQLLIPNDSVGVMKTFDFAERLLKLPIYRLHCTISEEAVQVAYRALIQGEK